MTSTDLLSQQSQQSSESKSGAFPKHKLQELLSIRDLPDNWIDCATGEAHIVREAFFESFHDAKDFYLPTEAGFFDYTPPSGYKPLVNCLEAKYLKRVIIANGAKQLLGAVFYSLAKMGKKALYGRVPYWCLLPPMAKAHNLSLGNPKYYDCYLDVAPNNPCGYCPTPTELQLHYEEHKKKGIPYIHDAAYFTHAYLPETWDLLNVGDVQIFSASKMFGLSGLRLGYAVVDDDVFYKYMCEYIEMMTVGASVMSQLYFYKIISRVRSSPGTEKRFNARVKEKLLINKTMCKAINQDVLQVPFDFVDNNKHFGLFGWFRTNSRWNPEKAKLHVINGKYFGDGNRVRLNLGLPNKTFAEVVKRLNSL